MKEITDWREQAEALFFMDHLPVKDICQVVRKTKKYVSGHLKACEGYEKEKAFRKAFNQGKRKEYQRRWDKENKNRVTEEEKALLKLQHIEAVNVLSHEKYY